MGPARVGAPGVSRPPRAVAVARVSLHSPDLLFGSKVEGALRAAGHEVVRGDGGEVAVVDLTEGDVPAPPGGVPAVGYYLHTDQDTRARA